ncbi:group II intron reverse transcriptase/maturase [Paenibacillus alginolyticus]|uniref:group II intron reverse transcriptase/maturase n=1 Tax=Paenibacillus alginolyticus TaxID=59839 RepID=UPI000492499D|nr:group II intron reverse transcriptase/maturase [Paenibacillus alginolyticus]MCY9665754.1 group II intron reverse transcriptase/maturase [Paenibacillus alginolyticus]
MVQKFDYRRLRSETDLSNIQDEIFAHSKQCVGRGDQPKFKDLLELISAETTILTAIHNIKGNKGSNTPGSDKKTMQADILEKDYPTVIDLVQGSLRNYKPEPLRRKFIPKRGKADEFRPLGIPAVIDRIVQECVRLVIEPILEPQFFNHSYGFRPMREASMALNRATFLVHNTGYHWIVEGDISKFFDNVNHKKLLGSLWHMGIRDRRVLMIVKAMLQAGVMGEMSSSRVGTPQGGIISPLLANVYLNRLDKWVAREWEEKRTRHAYAFPESKLRALRNSGNLKPAYLIRYADDWMLITDSKSNAEKWKGRIARYLDTNLKLKLSEEKTLITNVKDKPIHFLGYEFKTVAGKAKSGRITRTAPDRNRLKAKVEEIKRCIKDVRRVNGKMTGKTDVIHAINLINSQIRGMINYYQYATWVNIALQRYADRLAYTAYKSLKKHGGRWIPAKMTHNLTSVHSQYEAQIPAIEYMGMWIGITRLTFCKWKEPSFKIPKETPYTIEGRRIYRKRTNKKPILARADELLTDEYSMRIAAGQMKHPRYNFEFFLNRAYTFNRDKGCCRVCREYVQSFELHTHHINPMLPLAKVNKVGNLATTHDACHEMVHDGCDYSHLGTKVWNNILKLRKYLSK